MFVAFVVSLCVVCVICVCGGLWLCVLFTCVVMCWSVFVFVFGFCVSRRGPKSNTNGIKTRGSDPLAHCAHTTRVRFNEYTAACFVDSQARPRKISLSSVVLSVGVKRIAQPGEGLPTFSMSPILAQFTRCRCLRSGFSVSSPYLLELNISARIPSCEVPEPLAHCAQTTRIRFTALSADCFVFTF